MLERLLSDRWRGSTQLDRNDPLFCCQDCWLKKSCAVVIHITFIGPQEMRLSLLLTIVVLEILQLAGDV